MSKVSTCPECGYNAFGLDGDGHFCYNCGHDIDTPLVEGAPVFDCRLKEPIQEVEVEGANLVETPPPTIPLRQPQEKEEDMKTVQRGAAPKKAAPKNRAASRSNKKAPAKKSTKPKQTAKKAAPKKEGPKKGTPEYFAMYGKKDGEPVSRSENAIGGEDGFLNNLLIKNLRLQEKGQWKKMLSNAQLVEKFMAKFPGKNFQPMSNYISYFNRCHGGQGCDDLIRTGTDDALRSKSYWERQAAKK